MKKITILLTGLLFVVASSTLKSQTYDVGVTDLPTVFTNMTVYPNIPIQIQYTRQNFGAAVTSSVVDSFTMEIHADQIKRQTFYRNMGTPFGSGATETLGGVSNLDWGTLGLSAGPISVCAQTRLWSGGVLIDANPGNDQFCKVVNYSGDNNPFTYDMAISAVKAATLFENFGDGDSIPSGTSMLKVLFTIANAGSNDIPAGLLFDIFVEVDGVASANLPYIMNQPLAATGSIVDVEIDALANGISLPSGKTSYNLCVSLVPASTDVNHSNDKSCSKLYVKTGVGIADQDQDNKQLFEMNYFNRNLTVNVLGNVTGPIELNVMSVSGQRILTESFVSNGSDSHEVDLSKLTSGAFIAIATTEKGATETIRFVVD